LFSDSFKAEFPLLAAVAFKPTKTQKGIFKRLKDLVSGSAGTSHGQTPGEPEHTIQYDEKDVIGEGAVSPPRASNHLQYPSF
jgi:hypothetical protein